MSSTFESIILFLKNNIYIACLFVLLGSSISVILLMPRVLYVAYQKRLTAPIIARSSHTRTVPSLGGVAFFMTFMIFISLIEMGLKNGVGYNIIAAISILFMVGLKDDLVNSSARVKLYGQLLASLFIVFCTPFHIDTLHGFLGICELYPLVSILISTLFLTFIINAYNLIDGIDGLAAIIGIIISSTFMLLFFLKKDYLFFLLCAMTIGTLIGFLRFNLSSGRMKMFMGDCGSLLIGMMIGIFTLHYLSSEPLSPSIRLFVPDNRVIFISAVLFIPLFDTIRIIIIRILNGKSPFEADRNHLHHILLDKGFSHLKASLALGMLNVLVLAVFFIASKFLNHLNLLGIMVLLYLLIALYFYKQKRALHFKKTFSTNTNS